MNSEPAPLESSLEPNLQGTGHKLYLNRREKLEQKHEAELARCRISFDDFLDKYRNTNSNNINFNKVLEVVKVPFTGLPSLGQIRAFYQNYLSREKRRKYMKKGLWNEKELKLLLWSVVYFSEFIGRKIDEFNDADWLEVCLLFPNTPALKCKAKWFSIKKSKFMRSKWSQEEDNQLFDMMQRIPEKGKISWNDLAAAINKDLYKGEFIRTGRHCRDRWVHHLNPKLSRTQWSGEEDLQIVSFVVENGKKWAKLAKTMENRNEDSIRNRFIKLMKNYRNKEKFSRNNSKECTKSEGNMLSKLLTELSRKSMTSTSDEAPKPLCSKRKHAELSSLLSRDSELENLQVKLEMPEEKKVAASPTPKIEPGPQNISSKPLNLNYTEEKITKLSKQESQYPGKTVFHEVWEHFAFQNQILYQEMMIQRMRMMMNSVMWSQAFAEKSSNTTNNK